LGGKRIGNQCTRPFHICGLRKTAHPMGLIRTLF
jgi:hypothetical protein